MNQRGFDKWLVHERLLSIPTVTTYLPESVLFQDAEKTLNFLDRHGTVYIKPISGLSGRGIIKLSRIQSNHCLIEWREGRRRVKSSRMEDSELLAFLRRNVHEERYIVQQGIPLMKEKERLIDFRAILLKNRHGRWQVCAFIGKYGIPGSIVSNVSSGGKAEMGRNTLKKVWKLSNARVIGLRQRINRAALDLAIAMEQAFGVSYGDLSLDIGVEKNGKIWLIEVNGLGDHTIVLDAKNRKLYYEIVKENLLYMKKLAGFNNP
ncbi:YheC/YheD family protein [Paenibacillus thermotolerans]|uniref:YheC/YheD family protein n=1 Tax=Paenibacillus thermotolerans TaxID=3027807 RepID=UPI00236864EF|nr:YheC/YheD family protein [Paenibacillus sp. YIM B05602]